MEQDTYYSFTEIPKIYPSFCLNTLRFYRYKNFNNFNDCVFNIGRKLVISKQKFQKWIDDQTNYKSENFESKKDVLRVTFKPNKNAILTEFEIKYEDIKSLIQLLLKFENKRHNPIDFMAMQEFQANA